MKLDPGETAIEAKVFLVTGEDRSFNVAASSSSASPAWRTRRRVTLTANGQAAD